MKKWLSMIGTIALTTTTSTSVVACGDGEKNKILNYQKNEISTKKIESNNLKNKRNIQRYNNQENEYIARKILNIKNEIIYTCDFDSQNNIYIISNYGVYIIKNGEDKEIKINNIPKNNNMNTHLIKFDSNDNVYIGLNNGLYVLKSGETTATKINIITEIVRTMTLDNNDNLYIGTSDSAFVLKSGETTATKINGTDTTWTITLDNNDNVYIGTSDSAFVLKSGETTATKINGTDTTWTITLDNNDNVYIGTSDSAFVLKKGATKNRPKILIKILNYRTNKIVVDSNNNVYFSTDDDAFFLKSGETTATKISETNEVGTIALDSNDNVYIGTNHGLYFLKKGGNMPQKIKNINNDNNYFYFVFDKDNNLYLSFYNTNGLYKIFYKNTTAIKIGDIKSSVHPLSIDNQNNVYFSIDDDAFVLKNGKITPDLIDGITGFHTKVDPETTVDNIITSININSNDDIYFTSYLGDFYILENQSSQIFEKWYKFLEHDELKIEFNFNTVNKIRILFEKNKKRDFINLLKQLIYEIPKADHSGAGGSITEEDVVTVATVIWQHFPDFHETYKNMTNNQKMIIKTNTIGYWDTENSNNSIYLKN